MAGSKHPTIRNNAYDNQRGHVVHHYVEEPPAWLNLCSCTKLKHATGHAQIAANSQTVDGTGHVDRTRKALKESNARLIALRKAAKEAEMVNVSLMYAVEEGRIWQIDKVLKKTKDWRVVVNRAEGPDRETPLMRLAARARATEDPAPEVARHLIQRYHADFHAVDKQGRSAVMHAVMNCNTDVADELLRLRANINQPAKHLETALTFAVHSNDVRTCEWALHHLKEAYLRGSGVAVNPVNEEDGRGFTPLCHAAHGGELNAARWLLKRGADINIAGFKDFDHHTKHHVKGGKHDHEHHHKLTPVYLAATEGNKDVMSLLLRHGARIATEDIETFELDAKTWLDDYGWQFAMFDDKILHTAAFKRKDFDSLMSAVQAGDILKIETVLSYENFESRSTPLGARNPEGQSPVLVAAQHHTGRMLKSVLAKLCDDNWADINVTDDAGRTAIMLAARPFSGKSDDDILTGLADVQMRCRNGRFVEDAEAHSAPWYCFEGTNADICLRKLQMLLTGQGADLSDDHKQEMFSTLLERLDVTDSHGRRILEVAAQQGQREIVTWILEVLPIDANDLMKYVNHRTLLQSTAFLLAAKAGAIDICKDLVEVQADVSVADHAGKDFAYMINQAQIGVQARAAALAWWGECKQRPPAPKAKAKPTKAVVVKPEIPEPQPVPQPQPKPKAKPSHGIKAMLSRSGSLLSAKKSVMKGFGFFKFFRRKEDKNKTENRSPNVDTSQPKASDGLLRQQPGGKPVKKAQIDTNMPTEAEEEVICRVYDHNNVHFEVSEPMENHREGKCSLRQPTGFLSLPPEMPEDEEEEENEAEDETQAKCSSKDADGHSRSKNSKGSHDHKSGKHHRKSVKKVKKRWECAVCGKLNIEDRKTCRWCPGEPDRSLEVEIVCDAIGDKLRFVVEDPPTCGPRQGKVLHCYHNGHLESRVIRLHLFWHGKGLVEDFGYKYIDGELAVDYKTKASFNVPMSERLLVFENLKYLGRVTEIKVVSSGEYGVAQELARKASTISALSKK